MKPLLRMRTAMCVLVIGVLVAVGLSAGSSVAAQAKKASLTVTPGSVYLAGQQLTWTGNIGVSGKRKVHLEMNMNHGNGEWTAIPGNRGTTSSNGSFKFTYPAPGMFQIYMRVASGSARTPAKILKAQSQDLTLAVDPEPGLGTNEVEAGDPFTISVDTTPVIDHRPDMPTQVLAGRKLTLQQRVSGDEWKTLATTTVNAQGNGSFTRTVAPTGSFPATVTYRVREEDWNVGGSRIGWFPSFPLDVNVVNMTPRVGASTASSARPAHHRPVTTKPAAAVPVPFARDSTAAKANLWGLQLWDFAWEFGESLTSKPARGSDLKGYWSDTSDGSGRAAKLNGQLTLDSGRNYQGPGDYGTTRATLRGNPTTYGRWEARLRLKRFETNAKDYRALIELVPDSPGAYHCGAQNITVADVPVNGSTVGIGVRTKSGKQWTANRRFKIAQANATFAVEVSKKHITWFINGKPVGTVKSAAAVSDIPMTLRLSLVGSGDSEMDHTQMHSDWQRGWDLGRGKLRMDGASLKSRTFTPAC